MKHNDIVDKKFLKLAIGQSKIAAKNGNYPYGAILVHKGKIILKSFNETQSTKDITAHAELGLIRKAGKIFGDDVLSQSVLYSSCEPCAMCSGGIYWSGIKKVVYGCSTKLDAKISDMPFAIPCRLILKIKNGHKIEVVGPLLQKEASVILKDFWTNYFKKNKNSFGLSV